MSLQSAQEKYRQYFTEKIETFGATPQGVDYNGEAAQHRRYEELVRVIDPDKEFSVIDYGCGYGALYDFMKAKGWQFRYFGLDVILEIVKVAQEVHADESDAQFMAIEQELQPADYVLAGSIFNNKFDADFNEWTGMVRDTLQQMNGLAVRGLAFNMLTSYAHPERVAERPDLYFGDPLLFFDYCKRNFSRNVTLQHDYDLYDFTILVRMGA